MPAAKIARAIQAYLSTQKPIDDGEYLVLADESLTYGLKIFNHRYTQINTDLIAASIFFICG